MIRQCGTRPRLLLAFVAFVSVLQTTVAQPALAAILTVTKTADTPHCQHHHGRSGGLQGGRHRQVQCRQQSQ